MIRYVPSVLFFLFYCVGSIVNAQTIIAKKNGNWSDASVWDLDRVPTAEDTVLIRGQEIILSGDQLVRIAALRLMGRDDNLTYLKLEGQVNLQVNHYLDNQLNDEDGHLELHLHGSAQLEVGGHWNVSRSRGRDDANTLRVHIKENTRFSIGGNIDFQVDGSATVRVEVDDNSQVSIGGNASMTNTSTAGQIEWKIGERARGTVDFKGNLWLNSEKAGAPVSVSGMSDNTQLTIGERLIMTGQTDRNVWVALQNAATLNLGGSLDRTNTFGALVMSDLSTLRMTGEGELIVPTRTLPGAGRDSIQISNLILNSSSGKPIRILSDLHIDKKLDLQGGILKTDSTARLILGQEAQLVGGSQSAYVDGPIVKKGLIKGEQFFLPTGYEEVFAPIELTARNTASGDFMVRYMSCPPPYSTSLTLNTQMVSNMGYWIMERTDPVDTVDVQLHWNESTDMPDMDTSNLIVLGFVEGNGWTSFGQGDMFSADAKNGSGYVSSDHTCPPPYGTSLYTMGRRVMTTSLDPAINQGEGLFAVFPNPTAEIIHIHMDQPNTESINLSVMTASGQQVFHQPLSLTNGRATLYTESLGIRAVGSYQVCVSDGETINCQTLLKLK